MSTTKEMLLKDSIISFEDQPNILPDNWIWIKADSAAKWGSGGTPSRKNSEFYNGCIPWIKTGELRDNTIFDTEEKLTDLGLKKSSAKLFPADSVAIAMYGATIGRLGILGVEASTNQACAVGIPNKTTTKDFLFYYFLSQKNKLIEMGKGGAQPNISQTLIKEYPYPLPPLNEQKRLIKKIESLLSKVDKAKQLIEEAKDSFELRRAAILDKAFRGELTGKWRSLNRDRIIRTSGLSITDVPYELAEGWQWKKIGEIGELKRGKSKHRPRNDPKLFDGQYPFIQTGDVAKSNNYVENFSQTLSELGYEQSKLFPVGTVCITIAANIGDTAILKFPCCFPDSVVGFIPNENTVSSEYIHYYLSTIKNNLEHYAPATAQKNINLKILNEVLIPVPPKEEHDILIKELKDILDKEETLKNSLELKNDVELLKQSILSKAFQGELGTNDPTEENAIELLKEVLQEKMK